MSFGFASTLTKPQTPLSAALQLTFAGATSLDSRITFTRADATTCATYFGSDGLLKTAAANVPRFDYDPATPAGTTGVELAPAMDATWTRDASVAAVNGSFVFSSTPANTNGAYKSVSLTSGKTYKITLTTTNHTSGAVSAWLGGQQTSATNANLSSSGTVTFNVSPTAAYNGNFIIGTTSAGTVNATVSNISVQEVVFTPKGLLIEESRANLLLQSRDMTTASWTKTDVTPARTQVGLDGAANSACLMTAGVAGTSKTSQTSAAYTANSTVTISGVFKYGNCPWIMVTTNATGNGGRAWFNIQTGVKGTTVALGTGTSLTSSIISLGGGWYRCVFSCLPDATSTTAIFELYDVAGDGSTARVNNSTYIVDYAQLEVGAFATSPIPTTTAAVTRAADSASMTGTNFSSWYSQSAGTFVVEFSQPAATTDISRRLFAVNDGTAANQIQLSVAQTGQVQAITYIASVSSFAPTAAGAISANTVVKASLSLESPTKSLSRDGAVVQTASVAFPTSGMTQMLIGSQIGSNYACAHIRRLSFYAARLPNATLQSLTA